MFALLSRNRYLFPLTNFWIFYKIVKILKDIASSDLLYLLIIVQSPSYIYRLKNVLVLWTFLMRFQDSMVFLFFCFFFFEGGGGPITAWKVSVFGFILVRIFIVFGLNTERYSEYGHFYAVPMFGSVDTLLWHTVLNNRNAWKKSIKAKDLLLLHMLF